MPQSARVRREAESARTQRQAEAAARSERAAALLAPQVHALIHNFRSYPLSHCDSYYANSKATLANIERALTPLHER